jgi:hypothetical protein
VSIAGKRLELQLERAGDVRFRRRHHLQRAALSHPAPAEPSLVFARGEAEEAGQERVRTLGRNREDKAILELRPACEPFWESVG